MRADRASEYIRLQEMVAAPTTLLPAECGLALTLWVNQFSLSLPDVETSICVFSLVVVVLF